MNASALLFILAAVGIQRSKKFNISSVLIGEKHLRPAFETLIYQSIVLAFFCASIILTMWNFELLTTMSSIYIASESSILLIFCWIVQGSLLLREAEKQVIVWRYYEETATDTEYLKLKEQQYERLYY